MISDYRKYLDPSIISKLSNLELKAKFVVEGFIAGLHKSPFRGFSVEFAEHRQYMPGDDLKYLDWKILGRTDRYYIKQFEEETNLKSYVIVDSSKSMSFSSSNPQYSSFFPLKKFFGKKEEKKINPVKGISKLEYATYLAASISVLMNFQKDAVGLVVYDEKINTYIPPKATNQNLRIVLSALSKIESSGENKYCHLHLIRSPKE